VRPGARDAAAISRTAEPDAPLEGERSLLAGGCGVPQRRARGRGGIPRLDRRWRPLADFILRKTERARLAAPRPGSIVQALCAAPSPASGFDCACSSSACLSALPVFDSIAFRLTPKSLQAVISSFGYSVQV
jgi:hypothetical protein